ncbi:MULTISPECIES: SprT-like domain-containing protein [Haloferax]|uniref:Transcription elongation protein SprT n=1 Tax=Haloferax marinum TaxID=2666143 RepID=A0A6A8GDA8_9EURY|nr:MULTISPECIES: SprT-like domain-containing protein [Haloferax]KAB1191260.1 transcription elongation protein SprT [Haloferax sp. CBA1150]MRW98153.1 transcription elongation protein SprT [Haloferax marinum]
MARDDSGFPDDYDAVETHDELIHWSRAYCSRAVSEYGLDVVLEQVEWEVSTRAKRRAAAVKTPQVDGATVGERRDWAGSGTDVDGSPTCTMSLSWRAFESFGRDEWTATLRHELVHVEQFQAFGTTDHGAAFKRRAESIDAPVHVRRFSDPKYVLTCTDCGSEVAYRYRECKLVRNSSAYRSSCCGSSLACSRPRDSE